jgi:competence protein ComEC
MLLISLCLAWALGIFIGSKYHIPYAAAVSLVAPLLLAFFFKPHRKALIILTGSLASLFSAVFYYQANLPEVNDLSAYTDQTIEINGTVSTPPDVRDNITHLQISIQQINQQPLQGTVLLFVPRYPEFNYGDLLQVKGELTAPPRFENFDYQAYLARDGIYTTMLNPDIRVIQHNTGSPLLNWIYVARERLSRALAESLPEPQASLAQGIVLGIRSTIPQGLKNDLAVTGTAHLLAISGINLTIIAGILVALGLRLFGRRHYIYVWLAVLVIWAYALLTGLQAPVVRGAIMSTVFLLAELLGRQKNAIAALCLSGAIMIGIDPQIIFSVSFQLTFLAMIGLIFIAPPIQDLAHRAILKVLHGENWGSHLLTLLTDSLAVSLSAVILVWPVIAYNFGVISFVGPLATFVIAPALTPIILTGTVTATIGIVSVPAAQVIGWPAWMFLAYFIWVVQAFAVLPAAAVHTGPFNSNIVWIYYGVLSLAVMAVKYFDKLKKFMPKLLDTVKTGAFQSSAWFSAVPKNFVIIPLLVLATLTSFIAANLPDDNLHISFLDVGEGDAILIQNGSHNILIDGGPSPQAITLGLGSRLPFWRHNLDMILLTHPHLDHLSGLVEVLRRYHVQQVMAPALSSDLPAYQEWTSLIESKGIQTMIARDGLRITLGDGATLDILNPPEKTYQNAPDLENDGLVAKLTVKQISFLFTADIREEAENILITQRAGINCTVLKVAHHGSATSTSAQFLQVAQPQIAVISCGAGNDFGHPNPDTLTRLKGTDIYRTDIQGTIEFTTDGETLRVRTDR